MFSIGLLDYRALYQAIVYDVYVLLYHGTCRGGSKGFAMV